MSRREARPPRQSMPNKFRFAWRGLRRGIRSESNFFVHLFIAALVAAAGGVLGCTLVEWCLLALCVALVLVTEMFNTAIEHLARAITDRRNPFIANGLDMASAAVLLASCGAAVVGVLVLGNRLGVMLSWWQ